MVCENPVIAWVWLVAVTALDVAAVNEPGVPIVTAPVPVMVVKFIPLPADTLDTLPAPAAAQDPSALKKLDVPPAETGTSPAAEPANENLLVTSSQWTVAVAEVSNQMSPAAGDEGVVPETVTSPPAVCVTFLRNLASIAWVWEAA